ncbi:MAG: hypothetical protein U5N86_09505 [Planctomycetota bacterium]|nr:hypothetical protein [Planctomycetota bacterium]
MVDTAVTLAGFNNIEHSLAGFGETARVLKPGGMLLSPDLVLSDPSSTGCERAEKRGLADLTDISRIDTALRTFGLHISGLEEYASGTWPENKNNVIPASGDRFSLVLIRVIKDE